jgi:hypothetical protein
MVGYFVIPSEARNLGSCRYLQKPRSLTAFGMTKAAMTKAVMTKAAMTKPVKWPTTLLFEF